MAINRYTKPTQVQLAPLPYEGMLNRASQAVARKESMEYQDKVRQQQYERDDMLRKHQANLLASQAQGEAFGTVAAYDVDDANDSDYRAFLEDAREKLLNLDEDASTTDGIKNIYSTIGAVVNDPKLKYWKYDKEQKTLANNYLAANKGKLRNWEIEDIYKQMESPTISINEQGQEEYNPFTFTGVGQKVDWTSRLAALAKNIVPDKRQNIIFDKAGNPIAERLSSELSAEDVNDKLIEATRGDDVLMDEVKSFVDYAEKQSGRRLTPEERTQMQDAYITERASSLGGIFEQESTLDKLLKGNKRNKNNTGSSYKPIIQGQTREFPIDPVEGETREDLGVDVKNIKNQIKEQTKKVADIKEAGSAYSGAELQIAENKLVRLQTQSTNLNEIQGYVMENYNDITENLNEKFMEDMDGFLDRYFTDSKGDLRAMVYVKNPDGTKKIARGIVAGGARRGEYYDNGQPKVYQTTSASVDDVTQDKVLKIKEAAKELQKRVITNLKNGEYGNAGEAIELSNMRDEYYKGLTAIFDDEGLAVPNVGSVDEETATRAYYQRMDAAYDKAYEKFIEDAEFSYQGPTISAINQDTLKKQLEVDYGGTNLDQSTVENFDYEVLSTGKNDPIKTVEELEDALGKGSTYQFKLVKDALAIDKYSRPLSAPRAYLTYQVKKKEGSSYKDQGTVRVSALLGKNTQQAKYFMDMEQTGPQAFRKAGDAAANTFNAAGAEGQALLVSLMSQASQSFHPKLGTLGNDRVTKTRRYPFIVNKGGEDPKRFTATVKSKPSDAKNGKYTYRIVTPGNEITADSPESLFVKLALFSYNNLQNN